MATGASEQHLLPARGRFVAESDRAQQRARAAPEIADVRARVGRGFVETDAGDASRPRPTGISPPTPPRCPAPPSTVPGTVVAGQMDTTGGRELIVMLRDLGRRLHGAARIADLDGETKVPATVGIPLITPLAPNSALNPQGVTRSQSTRCTARSPRSLLVSPSSSRSIPRWSARRSSATAAPLAPSA